MLEDILIEIGLNDREVKVYLATLELGASTVLPISDKSGIKRTYCYDILTDLQKKGLVTYYEQNNRRRYVAEDPKKIEQILKNRLESFKEVLPDLRGIYNKAVEKPAVRYYDGKEGVLTIYQELMKVKSFDAIASPQYLYQNLGETLDLLNQKMRDNKVKIRELITTEGVGADYIMQYRKPLQEARLLPESVKIATDMLLFSDKLAMISYGEHIHAVVIESANIVNTQKMLFETIWATATRI